MKYFILFITICTLAAPAAAKENMVRYENGLNLTIDYFNDLQDIPVAPGLQEVEDAALVYDKPDGRIIEQEARGKARLEDILDFYKETLPQLGWVQVKGGEFGYQYYYRNDEELKLRLKGDQNEAMLRLTLTPKPEKK